MNQKKIRLARRLESDLARSDSRYRQVRNRWYGSYEIQDGSKSAVKEVSEITARACTYGTVRTGAEKRKKKLDEEDFL